MKKFCLTFALLLFLGTGAQSQKNRIISIPVQRNGIWLREPWVGGMNAPQFSTSDFNFDGIRDLMVFDREGDKLMTYIGNANAADSSFDYAPQYESLFPSGLNSWALLRDYNDDGVPDLFTFSSGGTKVYKGSNQNGAIHFDLACPLLQYMDGPDFSKVFTNYGDIPVLADVDHDGDLDVLAYNQLGATVFYYQNQTREHPGDIHYDIDSFKFTLASSCWGNFEQDANSNSIRLNITCKGADAQQAQGDASRHAGNSLFSFDEGNDGDVDLLNGNIGFNNLVFLKNCGDSSFANVCEKDSVYPVCNVPMSMFSYPAAYGVHIDENNDLLISPNQSPYARDVKNVMYYRNTSDTCQFQYQNDSFLVHHMLDFGTESKAVFYDYDGDGLKDIIVGNFGYFRPNTTYHSTLAYLKNIGTATNPVFQQQTDDLQIFGSTQLVAINPTFGDLDGDGKADCVTGELTGTLVYYKNQGTGNASSFPAVTNTGYFSLDVGQSSAPFLYDMNGDSLLDLVVGRQDGKLSYYWNYGTRNNAQFNKDSVNNNFGGVNVCIPPAVDGFSQPFVWKDAGGLLKLFVGSKVGLIYEYQVDASKLRSGTFTLITNNFVGEDVGAKSTIAIADLNGDGEMEYLLGNSRGGLMMYSDSVWNPSTRPLSVNDMPAITPQLRVYPNPAKTFVTCALENLSLQYPKAEVFDMLGKRLDVDMKYDDGKIVIATDLLNNGLYVVRVFDANKSFSAKVLIAK